MNLLGKPNLTHLLIVDLVNALRHSKGFS